MRCPSCGREIGLSQLFCTYCGTKLAIHTETENITTDNTSVSHSHFIGGLLRMVGGGKTKKTQSHDKIL